MFILLSGVVPMAAAVAVAAVGDTVVLAVLAIVVFAVVVQVVLAGRALTTRSDVAEDE
jgi:hypothetical protein